MAETPRRRTGQESTERSVPRESEEAPPPQPRKAFGRAGPEEPKTLEQMTDDLLIEALSPGMRSIIEELRDRGEEFEQMRKYLRKREAPQHLIHGVDAYWQRLHEEEQRSKEGQRD